VVSWVQGIDGHIALLHPALLNHLWTVVVKREAQPGRGEYSPVPRSCPVVDEVCLVEEI